MSDRAIAIGVVVIGRNEGERLISCLRSVADSGLRVVYVDSASTDGSQAVARSFGAVVVELDLERPFTAARARREGAATLIALAPDLAYVQFVDGDCALAPAWLGTACEFLDNAPNYAVACGRRREREPRSTVYNRIADLEWNTPVGEASTCGGDAMFRCTAYFAVGGFDETLIAGEEPELCSRLGAANWRICRLDAEMTLHDAAMTRLSQWWRRAVRSGFGYAQAWCVTSARRRPLYGRELLRASAWAMGLPLLSLATATLIHPLGWLTAPTAYALQIVRLAATFGIRRRFSWQHALLLTLGKFAEAWGALLYVKRTRNGSSGSTIIYK